MHNVTMPPLQMNQTSTTLKTTMSGLPPQTRLTKRSNFTTVNQQLKTPESVGFKFGNRSRSVQNAQFQNQKQQQQQQQ